MNKRIIAYFLSGIGLFMTLLLFIYFSVAFLMGEIIGNIYKYGILITFSMFLISMLARKIGIKKLESLNTKDAILAVCLSWFSIIFMGAIPYLFYGENWVNAIFESCSGFSTTGATIMEDIEKLPHSLLLWRSTTQWVGGMGIIVFFVTIIPSLGQAGKMLFRSEVPGPIKENLTPQLRNTTKQLWILYTFLTIVLMILLKVQGMSFFDAVNHAFSTISTGGFSTKNKSLAYYSPSIQWTTSFFMLIGGINFAIFLLLATPNRFKILKDTEIKFYLLIILIASVAFSLMLFFTQSYSLSDAFRKGIFTIISFLTTTGYSNFNYFLLSYPLQAFLIIFFIIGGCGGSTSGGIKIYRVTLVLRSLSYQIKKSLNPYLVSSIKIASVKVSDEIIMNVFVFILVNIIFLSIGSIILFMDIGDFLSAFTITASSLGNVGPFLVGESENPGHWNDLSSFVKLISCFFMLLGRLEFFTLLAIFHPLFWKKH